MRNWKQKLREYGWNKHVLNPSTCRSCTTNYTHWCASKRSIRFTTPLDRPCSLRTPSATNQTNTDSHVIMSIVEGRGSASGEIGVASLDLFSPTLEVSQFQDTGSYSRTLIKLLILCPTQIVLPQRAFGPQSCMKNLIKVLQEFRPQAMPVAISRSRFNDRLGLSELLRLCHPEYHPAIRSISQRFYALSAVAALLSYVEETHGFTIAAHTLKFTFTGSFQTSVIDVHTACRLELVENLTTRLPKGSLFAAIDNTSNPGGARLLRTNLLQPPTDLSTILNRQNAVNELVSKADSLLLLQNILRRLPYIDGLLSFCIQMNNGVHKNNCTPFLHTDWTKSNKVTTTETTPNNPSRSNPLLNATNNHTSEATMSSRITSGQLPVNIRMAELRITKLIAVKSILDQVVPLKNALNELKSGLFETYRKNTLDCAKVASLTRGRVHRLEDISRNLILCTCVFEDLLHRTSYELLDDPRYLSTRKKLCTVLHEDIHLSKGLLAMQSQKCFAIKEGLNVVLDVTRKAYSEQLDDVTVEISRLSERYKLPLRVGHNKCRGFHIVIPEDVFKRRVSEDNSRRLLDVSEIAECANVSQGSKRIGSDSLEISQHDQSTSIFETGPTDEPSKFWTPWKLPPELVKTYVSNGVVHCTTESLIRLNERMKGSLHEVYYIADQIIWDLMLELHADMALFYRLSEVVANLDFLCSLALFAMRSSPECPFVYPQFGDTMGIRNGRNVLLEHRSKYKVVGNHVYASKHANVTIITGPSMSGKTTYLKQIAFIQVLAQIGSLVPAELAIMPIVDQIYFHNCGEDDLTSSESSFMKDIRELSFVLSQITSKSLVIIDGMCQSTNPEESRSLSWSICEVLSDRQTFAFIASSRTDLTRLSIVYPSIEIGHMRIEECNNAVNNEDIITGVTHPNSTFDSSSIDSRIRDQSQTNCLPPKGTPKFQTKWKFTYELMKGASGENPYGIRMICHTSFPEDIISRAEEILRKIHPSSMPVSTSLFDKSTLNPIANATNIETNTSLMASSDVRQAGQLLGRLTHHRLAFHFLRQVHRICKALKEDLDGKCQPTSDPITSEILGCLRFMRDFHRAVESGKSPLQIQH